MYMYNCVCLQLIKPYYPCTLLPFHYMFMYNNLSIKHSSLSISKNLVELSGKRIVLFSYGSGLASSMFSLRVSSDATPNLSLDNMLSAVKDVPKRLESRQTVVPGEFESTMKLREETHHLAPYQPVGDTSKLFPGTYYLDKVDDMHRRSYSRVPT